jgi:hypothetical protein
VTPEERKKLVAQAKLGFEAVIDEATGYQEVREPDALAKRYRELGGEDADYRAPDYPPESGSPRRVVCQTCGWSGRRRKTPGGPCPRCWGSRLRVEDQA